MSESTIETWCDRRRLHPLFAGAYAVGHSGVSREGRWLAATLAAGGTLSHLSAGVLWDLIRFEAAEVDVTTALRSRDGRAGMRLHRPVTLCDGDLVRHRGIPVTSVSRTLIDLAYCGSPALVRRAWDQAEIKGLMDYSSIRVRVGHSRRKGSRILRELLATADPTRIGQVRSSLEIEFMRLLRRHNVPEPRINEDRNGHIVDFVWQPATLIVEVDGGPWHGTTTRRNSDKRRDRRHQLDGYAVLRFDDSDIEQRPREVVDEIKLALRRRTDSHS